MEICGQQLDAGVVERIAGIARSAPGDSRRALSRRICEAMGWRAANGRLQEMSCRKILKHLESQGIIGLPEVNERFSFQQRSQRHGADILEVPRIACGLKELGSVEVVPVSSRYAKASRIWNELMDGYHYLGSGPLCGAQIRYLIRNEREEYLGGLSFSAATWRLKVRDEWIGWSERARRANLGQVVLNSRFLILPTVQVPHLASHVLSLAASRLCDDWEARYGLRPMLIETFVDGTRYKGTCYRAANWIYTGQTKGRTRNDQNRTMQAPIKDVYVYPLSKRFDWELCHDNA